MARPEEKASTGQQAGGVPPGVVLGGLTGRVGGRILSLMSEDYPKAPSQEQWEAMSEEERARVVESLPGEVTDAEMSPPEGDLHMEAKVGALGALRGFFSRNGRRFYVASELPVYYPDEPRFAPDLLVVLEVEAHRRDKWVVQYEGRGLDFVLEVHVGGNRKKDAQHNVERYGRLGIPEYFVYDRKRQRLEGWRLAGPGAKVYERMEAREGRYRSETLGLELVVEEGRLRFYAGSVMLLEYEELVAQLHQENEQLRRRNEQLEQKAEQLEQKAEQLEQRAEQLEQRNEQLEQEKAELRERAREEARRRKEEARRRKEEARRREQVEQELAGVKDTLARLLSLSK
jgi:Uma2 family endonuclease